MGESHLAIASVIISDSSGRTLDCKGEPLDAEYNEENLRSVADLSEGIFSF